ncbi:hypothetical protein Tco_0464699 [Tanacetum coccineum]
MAENLIPFTHAQQFGFNLKDVIMNTNNEVAILYPKHSNKEVFLWGKTGGFDQITNKDAIILYYLDNGVNIDYAIIFWEDIIKKLKKKNREKVIPYIRFLSLLMMQKMKDGYGDAYMVAICNAEKPVAFKAPRTSSHTEKKVSQGIKLGAKAGHKKQLTSSKQPHMSSSEATKGGSFKAPSDSKTDPSRKRKESSSAKDLNPSQPLVFTPVVTEMHKEDQQASASVIVHSDSTSGHDASADSIAKVDPETSALNDSLLPQQGKYEGTKNYSLDHIFTGTDPNFLADKTKSVSDGLETVLTTPKTGTNNVAKPSGEIKFREIKLEDLAKLVLNIKANFKDLDSPNDDPIIIVNDSEEDEEEDKNEEIHSTINDETKGNSASTSLSPRSIQPQELTNQVLLLQSQKHTLETEKTKAEAEIAQLKAQPPSPTTSKAGDQCVPSAGQASTMPAEGEKYINQATIS